MNKQQKLSKKQTCLKQRHLVKQIQFCEVRYALGPVDQRIYQQVGRLIDAADDVKWVVDAGVEMRVDRQLRVMDHVDWHVTAGARRAFHFHFTLLSRPLSLLLNSWKNIYNV